MDSTPVFTFILFFANLGLGIYAISRDPRSALNRTFLALIASTVLWVGAYNLVFTLASSAAGIWFWYKIASPGWISLPFFCVYFALVLTGRINSMPKRSLVFISLPIAVEIILMFTIVHPSMLTDISRYMLTDFISPRSDWFWYLHTPYYLLYSTMMLIIIAQWGRSSMYQREKRQARIIVRAGLLLLGCFLLQYSLLPSFGILLPWLVPMAGLLWLVAILYAITRYKLMDLQKALSLDDILSRSTDIILLLNRSDQIMLANHKAQEVLAYPAKKLPHLSLAEIIPEGFPDTAMIKQKDLTMEKEVFIQTARGELIPVKASIATIKDDLQDTVGLLFIGQDLRLPKQLEQKIAEMKNVESALRESEAKYRNIFENAYDMIYMHDVNGRYLSVNKASEKLLGYSEDELVHMNALHFVVPEQRQRVIDLFLEKRTEHQLVYYEVTIINRYGEKFDLNVSRQLIFETPEETVYQCIARDMTERKQMEEKLKYLSMHDAMTGLYNRAYFTEELKRMESGRHEPSSIILCDLDYLKKVNDNYGHAAGDEMIIAAAQLIKSCFRSNDVVARFGGDEFAIVVPKSNDAICLHLVEKIQTAIDAHNQTSPFIISISIGYATRTRVEQPMQEVFQQADQAMYADKAQRKKLRS
ncbi:MAG TPA: diguanylate cyclase [Syntrophomonas sp.]|nr:diguanylate cyclase [Syntrophomonas sp.]